MGTGKIDTQVTLDGRALVYQGRNIIELADLQAAQQEQAKINGETPEQTPS